MTSEFWFLFFTTDDREEGSKRHKKIIARNIKWACKKFLKWSSKVKRWPVCIVDYEVESNGGYIDISDEPGFEKLMG